MTTVLPERGRVHDDWKSPVPHLVYVEDVLGPADLRNRNASAAEMKMRLGALRAVHVRTARNSFPAFMQYCFADSSTGKPFLQQWFHDEWSRAWDTKNRVLIIAPRDHGKTSQIVGRVIWELGRNPDLRIKIACAADGRAKERLFEIIQHIEQNKRILHVFPELKEDKNAEWSKHKIVVKRSAPHRDASVEALGITATATGGRCDLLIADDVVDRRNALSFPKLRQQIKQAWKSDWTNLLEPESRVWYICTLWHKDDLSHELMANTAYHTMFYAVPPAFGALWPEKWPEKELRARHQEIGSVEFNRGFRNHVVDDTSRVVHPEWLKFKDLSKDDMFLGAADRLIVFTSYDTARATHLDSDYSACTIIAVDPDAGLIYVLDAWHDRISVAVQSQRVWSAFCRYKPYRVLIEKVGQAVLDEWVINDHPEIGPFIEVTTPRISKVQRLLAVTPLMEAGRVIFSKHLDPNHQNWQPGKENLIHELEDFPFSKHDDLVDSFSQALSAARGYVLDAWAIGLDNQDGTRATKEHDAPRYLF